jgi:diguanylate cyclase (GGDEF)-like protein
MFCRVDHMGLELAFPVRTNADVVRWTAIQTVLAVGFVVPATALALLLLYRGDLSRLVDGHTVMRFCLALSTLEALVFAPAVASRSSRTLKELNLARDELDRLVRVDPLTGLLNRRGFDQEAGNPIRPPGAWGRPMAVVMCDLDHFKGVNDRFGHEFGDAALRQVANVLRSAADEGRVVLGRQGGEEFVLLLTDLARADALAFAESLRRTIAARPVECDGNRATITMSFGVAAIPACQGQVFQLIAQADAALFMAKRSGRNCVVEFREVPLIAA